MVQKLNKLPFHLRLTVRLTALGDKLGGWMEGRSFLPKFVMGYFRESAE